MRSAVAREIALVYLFVAVVTLVVSHTPGAFMSMYGHLLLAGAFLGSALRMARREGHSAVEYGIDLSGLLEAREDEPAQIGHGTWFALRRALPRLFTELGFALCVAAVVFPPFILLFRLWHGSTHDFTWHPPSQPVDFLLTHLIAIALPEEALFRGYFQTRLSDLFPRRIRVLGAALSPSALLVQAALFALLHFLVGFSPARLAVFFPGLLFGWIRARRSGIGAAVWFHALCNVLAELLTRGYL